ncbi:hypothetical protein Mal15_14530 [Stieleria maiorica]|uniref:PhnB-like domain-containing protein n=1 Tax=Stieleria maiorica TaxID=2795974 RepID=A0A5B9M9P9_9BACT|nr:DUF1579 family protein [Stieleria maiorica]QEF97413.1 hypothetical protein Mal15_14530 [Stieleria maiorica]
MKTIPLTASFLLIVLSTFAVAQETSENDDTASMRWLQKFNGRWRTVSRSPDKTVTHTGSMTSRSIGNRWVVNEFQTNMGGFQCHALQTLGVDSKRNVFIATWVDNALDYRWNYEGELDQEKSQLTFVAEGPSMTDKGATARYRDLYEFRNEDRIVTTSQIRGGDGNWKTFMSGELIRVKDSQSTGKPNVATLLMFQGNAEQAINYYTRTIPNSEIETVTKYVEGENGKAGTIKHATFRVAGAKLICIDSPVEHEFDFTPSISLFIDCESETQVKSVFEKLSRGGKVLMPLDDYGFSTRFGWLTDQFGVSWQINFGELK